MSYCVFAKVSNYYLLIADEERGLFDIKWILEAPVFLKERTLDGLGSRVSRSVLLPLFNADMRFHCERYTVFNGERCKILIGDSSSFWARLTDKQASIAASKERAEHALTKFSLNARKRLVESLYGSCVQFDDHLLAFLNYIFCEHYSFWIYNPITRTFVCVNSSSDKDSTFIGKYKGTSLDDVFDPGYQNECRPPKDSDSQILSGVKCGTVNRLKFEIGVHDELGVLDFYSARDEFCINSALQDLIINFVRAKYREHIQERQERFEKIVEYFGGDKHANQPLEFVKNLVNEISVSLCFEACSIFIFDKAKKRLVLVAIKDMYHSGAPSEDISYDLSESSLTAAVFRENKIRWSYDIASDPQNSRKFSEKVSLASKNWVGLPISIENEVLGVLRVKNKYVLSRGDTRKPCDLRPIDFTHLKIVCSFIAGVFQVSEQMRSIIQMNEDLEGRIKQQQDFDRVFLHEVRTPIQTFSSAPERILHELSNGQISEEKVASLKNKISDIATLAHRLTFITNTYYFEKIVTNRNYEYLMVLRDVVFPVVNITRQYLKKQYEQTIDIDQNKLNSVRVYGDKLLLNIVVNALIDNASKYSDQTKRPISVTGKHTKTCEYFEIEISNWGIEILASEKDAIFEKGFRGELARKLTEGTGIGLFLCKRIMEECGGDLRLASRKNPVRFVMRIPTEKEVLENVQFARH